MVRSCGRFKAPMAIKRLREEMEGVGTSLCFATRGMGT